MTVAQEARDGFGEQVKPRRRDVRVYITIKIEVTGRQMHVGKLRAGSSGVEIRSHIEIRIETEIDQLWMPHDLILMTPDIQGTNF